MTTLTTKEKIDRLNSLSKTHAILPDEFVPWENEIREDEVYMPEYLFSLYGTALVEKLTKEQLLQLNRFEAAQVMATYAWSETIGCLMFNKMFVNVTATSPEGKYMVNMIIEEL